MYFTPNGTVTRLVNSARAWDHDGNDIGCFTYTQESTFDVPVVLDFAPLNLVPPFQLKQ